MPRATSGSHIATSTDATTRPMPDANATKPARAFGLTAKIFIASTLLVVAVLGISFGVTSIQANRTADASIGRALAATRRAVENQLSSRTHGLATAAGVSASVPQYRARLLNAGRHNDALDQANDV